MSGEECIAGPDCEDCAAESALEAIVAERDALRAAYDDLEAARLETMDQRNEARAAVERVRALAEAWDERHYPGMVGIAKRIRAALDPE